MQLLKVVLALAATTISVSEACKCWAGGNPTQATESCCSKLGGDYTGSDCKAGSISEHLSNFYACCERLGATSDCDCPWGCGVLEAKDAALTAYTCQPTPGLTKQRSRFEA